MNWEAVGAIGEILGAVVVVATIFYLAIQIRHSHSSNQMVAASRIAESADAWLGQLVQDKELNDIYQNGMRDYSSLEQSDQSRFDLLIVQFLRSIEAAWTQDELGVLGKNQWYGYKMTTRLIIGSHGGSVAFDKMRTSFSPAFCTAIEEIISSTEEQHPRGEKFQHEDSNIDQNDIVYTTHNQIKKEALRAPIIQGVMSAVTPETDVVLAVENFCFRELKFGLVTDYPLEFCLESHKGLGKTR